MTAWEGKANAGTPVHSTAVLAPAMAPLVPGGLAGEQGRAQSSIELEIMGGEGWHPEKIICIFEKTQSNLISNSALGSAYTFGVFSRFPQDTSQP